MTVEDDVIKRVSTSSGETSAQARPISVRRTAGRLQFVKTKYAYRAIKFDREPRCIGLRYGAATLYRVWYWQQIIPRCTNRLQRNLTCAHAGRSETFTCKNHSQHISWLFPRTFDFFNRIDKLRSQIFFITRNYNSIYNATISAKIISTKNTPASTAIKHEIGLIPRSED